MIGEGFAREFARVLRQGFAAAALEDGATAGQVARVDADGQLEFGAGGGSLDGGLIALEVSTDTTLVDGAFGGTLLAFDELFSTSADVTLGVDDQTLTFNETGWYTVWYSFAVKASADTVKSEVELQLACSDPLNWIGQTSLGETQLHLSGATSLHDMAVTFTSPPIHFTAADTLKFRAALVDTAGSVGDSIVSSNTYATVIRIA